MTDPADIVNAGRLEIERLHHRDAEIAAALARVRDRVVELHADRGRLEDERRALAKRRRAVERMLDAVEPQQQIPPSTAPEHPGTPAFAPATPPPATPQDPPEPAVSASDPPARPDPHPRHPGAAEADDDASLLALLAEHAPDGLSTRDIDRLLPDRTGTRWSKWRRGNLLRRLVADGRARTTGATNSLRYHAAISATDGGAPGPAAPDPGRNEAPADPTEAAAATAGDRPDAHDGPHDPEDGLRTAEEWIARLRPGHYIAVADGWSLDGTPVSKRIDEREFRERMAMSEIRALPGTRRRVVGQHVNLDEGGEDPLERGYRDLGAGRPPAAPPPTGLPKSGRLRRIEAAEARKAIEPTDERRFESDARPEGATLRDQILDLCRQRPQTKRQLSQRLVVPQSEIQIQIERIQRDHAADETRPRLVKDAAAGTFTLEEGIPVG